MRLNLTAILLLITLSVVSNVLLADSDEWIVGKWHLVYDPDGGETDYLEFRDNGDLITTGPHGEYHGFYIVSHGSVKAVMTSGDKDVLLTFLHNKEQTQLRIVTSLTGKASIYEKLTQ